MEDLINGNGAQIQNNKAQYSLSLNRNRKLSFQKVCSLCYNCIVTS